MPQDSQNLGVSFDLKSVNDIFTSNAMYAVPTYQRNYSWGKDEIDALLGDVDDARRDFPDEAYLLGQIITCPSNKKRDLPNLDDRVNQLDIIDGQQRLTTLFLIMAQAISRMEDEFTNFSDFNSYQASRLEQWKLSLKILSQDGSVYPKVLPAQDGDIVLRHLIDYDYQDPGEGESLTQRNLVSALSTIENWFETIRSTEELFNFLTFLMDKVQIIQITLNTSAHALRVFQKVNNRGLELDNADLIKSFLFQHVPSDSEYNRFGEAWDEAATELLKSSRKSLKNMEGFMKMLIGIRTGTYVSKGKLYEEWEKELALDRDSDMEIPDQLKLPDDKKNATRVRQASLLISNLASNAKSVVRISKDQIPASGEQAKKAHGVISGGFIQPVEVLLAGSHLSNESYENLLRIVEDRAILSSWAGEPKNLLEPLIHPWALRVSKLDTHATIEEIRDVSQSAYKNLPDLLEEAFMGINRFSYQTKSHYDRVRYFLARAHLAVQREFNVSVPSVSSLMTTTNYRSKDKRKGYDLDHVFPKSENKRGYWVKDLEQDLRLGEESRYLRRVHSVGNLILLHPDDNRNQSDELPWSEEKINNLKSSELYLNRFLVPHEELDPANSKIWQAAKEAQLNGFPTISNGTWGEVEIAKMADFYWKLVSGDVIKTLKGKS